MAAWTAFQIGLRRALAYWQVLLMLLLGALLAAGLLALLPGLAMLPLADTPLMAEIAAGVQARHVVDLFGQLMQSQAGLLAGAEPGPLPAGLVNGLLALALSYLLLPALGGIVSAFLYGGLLQTYRQAPAPFRWGRFFADCWHGFGGYLLLAALQAGLFVLIVLPPALLLFALLAGAAPWGPWLAAALVVGLLIFWTLLFELARVQMAVRLTRNPFRGLGYAFASLLRFPAALLGFTVLALAALLLAHLLFRLGLLPLVPLEILPLSLLVQQGFILARLYLRAARLAGLLALIGPAGADRGV